MLELNREEQLLLEMQPKLKFQGHHQLVNNQQRYLPVLISQLVVVLTSLFLQLDQLILIERLHLFVKLDIVVSDPNKLVIGQIFLIDQRLQFLHKH